MPITPPAAGANVTADPSAPLVSNAPGPQAKIVSDTGQQTLDKTMKYGLQGMGIGLFDTLGQSLGVFDDKTVENKLKYWSPDGIGDYYANNKTGLRAGGEIMGLGLPGMIGGYVLRGARYAREIGALGDYFKNSSAVEALLGSAATLTNAEQRVSQTAAEARASQGIFAGKSYAIPAVDAAKRGYFAARAAETVRQTAIFTAAYRELYNHSEILYPADYTISDELKWSGAATALGVGMDFAVGRYAVRKLIQAASASHLPAVEGTDLASQVIFRPNDRGAGMTYFASQKTQYDQIAKASSDVTLVSNIGQDRTLIDGILSKQLNGMAGDYHLVLPKTQLDNNQIRLGLNTLSVNETTFLFATKLAQVPEDAIGFYGELDKGVRKAQAAVDELQLPYAITKTKNPGQTLDEAKVKLQQWQDAATETHYVIENTGDISAFRNRAPNWLDTNSLDVIKPKTEQEALNPGATKADRRMVSRTTYSTGPDSRFILDDKFVLTLDRDANSLDRSATFAAASKMIQRWKPVENQQPFIVNEKLPWFQLEGTMTLAAQNPAAKSLIQLNGDFRTFDDVTFNIVDQKYQEFSKLMNQTERASRSPIAAVRKGVLDPAEITQRLNLPIGQGLMPSPLIEVFAQGRAQGAKTLEEMLVPTRTSLTPNLTPKMDLLQAAMREAVGVTDTTVKFPTAGKLFLQNDTRPIFVAAKSVPMLSRNEAVLHGMIETRRDLALSRLNDINPGDAPVVKTVLNNTINLGALSDAKDVMSLHDGVASGRGNAVYQDRINEQFPALKAAALTAQSNEKIINDMIGKLAQVKLTPLVAKLLNPKNKDVLFDFNRIEQSYRHGWDIKELEDQGDGSYRFVLNPTDMNEKLAQQYFGKGLKDMEIQTDIGEEPKHYLPDMSVTARKTGPTPLTVSADAAQTAQSISELSRQSGVEVNALRVALGKGNIRIRDFHLPTPELFREGTYFVRNSRGDVVATYTGGTEGLNKSRSEDAAKKLMDATNEVHTSVPLDDVRRAHNIFDDTFFDIINYSDQLAKTGSAARGGLVRTEIDTGPETLKAMVMSLNEQFLQAGTRAQAAIFEPQLNYAEQASQVAQKNSKLGPNIFDRYQAIIYGRAPQTQKQALTAGYGVLDGVLDKSLSWLNARYSEAIASTEAGKAGARSLRQVLRNQTSEKEFQQYQANLPKWGSPFQTTQDWLESTFRETPNVTARNMSARLSLLSSAMSLRILDMGTPLLNLSGVAATAPAIIASMRKLPTENFDEWIKRTAAWGTRLSSSDITTFSGMKALTNTIHAFWSGELTGPLSRAADKGYFTPEYMALAHVLTDPKYGGPNTLERWTKAASWMADNSEILSRKLAWGMGYKIGMDLHKFTDERNAFIYANNFLNDMIGNYDPKNKPAMFRGAVGLPLGAFQTYMFNFYRRMYGYIERKDRVALAAQYATQASLFGAAGTPGWGAFNQLMFSNYDGSDSINTRLDRALPPGVSELLLHGSLSSIPAIFGQGGIAFYPRGSVDFTQPPPTIADFSRAPPVLFLASVAKGIANTVDNTFGAGGFSVQQQEEILANMSTNRAFKSIMELAANAKTDQRGDVIDIGTRDAIHVAAAMMGTVPSEERRMQDAYNSQQLVEKNQENLRAELTDKTRALIRGGDLTVERLQPIIQGYIRSGGNPAYFGQWLRNTTETATTPKAIMQLQELSKSGKMLEFMNMLAALQQNQPLRGQLNAVGQAQ